MNTIITYKAVIIIAWFILIFIGERLLRAAPYPSQFSNARIWERLGSNLSLSLINMILSPLLILPLTFFLSQQFTLWRPEWMQHWGFFIIDLLILDAFLYGWHRANHRIPFLWRFHEVHHLDEFLDSTTALRFHFGEVFISALVRVMVIVLFAIPLSSVVLFEIILMVLTIFNHSNIKLYPALENALSKVVVTPSIHWVHHHKRQVDTDSNYATIFSFWDGCFGTRNPKRRWNTMVIGVEKRSELSLWRLLLRPFTT